MTTSKQLDKVQKQTHKANKRVQRAQFKRDMETGQGRQTTKVATTKSPKIKNSTSVS